MQHRVRLLVAGLLTALAVVAGACSGGDASRPGATGATSTAAPSTTARPAALERYEGHRSALYDDPAHWLCRPGRAGDACDVDLDTTVVAPDGSTEVVAFEPAEDPPVDCFYVYPTVSRDPAATSDWTPGDTEERFVVVNQAARLQAVCRLYAPLYRQVTTTALVGGAAAGPSASDPYADVLDAFRTYMARDNGGRGVVLVGHSQGTLWLNRLLREEVDPNPGVRELLVGAYLAGGRVNVPPGGVVGGDLTRIPLCTSDGEHGCVTTWSSVLPAAPPLPVPRGGRVVGCVNPASVGGSGTSTPVLTAEVARAVGRTVDGTDASWTDPASPIRTPFVQLPGRLAVSCRPEPGGARLQVSWTEDPAASVSLPGGRGADLHLLDVNLVMGDVIEGIREQSEGFAGR